MPGWPVRVFISLAGSCYHATPYCPLLKASQEKAAERGHVVTRIACISMNEAQGASAATLSGSPSLITLAMRYRRSSGGR